MGVLALDTKNISSVLRTIALYLLVIVIASVTMVKSANASGTVSYATLASAGPCTDIPWPSGDTKFYTLVSCVEAGTGAVNGYVNWVSNQCAGCDIYADTPCTSGYCFADFPITTRSGCPINSTLTGTNTCTCDTNFNPNLTATNCLAANAPNPPKNAGPSCQKQQYACTNPVNAGTGNKYQHEADYSGLGVYPLHAERTYNSGGTTPRGIIPTVWGSQWRGIYDRTIAVVTNSVATTAVINREDGRQHFYRLVSGAWVGDADVVGTLVQLANSAGWTYVNESDETETYNASGQLVTITNRAGQTQTLTYSDGTAGANGGYVLTAAGAPTTTVLPAGCLIRVTNPASRTLQFGYDGTGRVVKMTDPNGRTYAYAYSDTTSTANLTSVTYPDDNVPGGMMRTYLYGEAANVSSTPNAGVSYAHALTGIVDENGNRFASWTYDANGLATSSEHGVFGSGIDHVRLAYGTPDASGNSTTTVIDPRNNTRSYGFSTLLGVVKNTGITGQPCNGCDATVPHDANGNVASRTDFNGNTTCYAYDLTRNLETVRVEGLSLGTVCPATPSSYTPSTTTGSVERKITTQWNATFRLPAVIAEPLRKTTYVYNGDVVGGTAITCGNKTDGTTPVPGVLCSMTIQPTTDTTGAQGLSASATATPPSITNYTYNAAGQVLNVDGPRTDVSDITSYGYDTQGNLTSVTNTVNPLHPTILGNYDANGRPGKITDPNGLVTGLTYDARGRLKCRNAGGTGCSSGGEITSYTYYATGELKTVTLPTGAVYTYTDDATHRLTDIYDSLGNHIHYTLDVMGNRTLEQIFDTGGNIVKTHSREFNALNQLWHDIGAVNTVEITTYDYDLNGNPYKITAPFTDASINRITINAYDALNRLNQVTNPDNGIIKYSYDGLDQLTQVTDPNSLVTGYTRDGLGNLYQQVSPDTGPTGNTYDAAGNLHTRTDAKNQTATYTYDALNRVTGISYTGGTAPAQTVAYQYDQGSNCTYCIGHLAQITDTTGVTNYSYDQHGRLTNETRQAYGATYIIGYGYDAQGRLNVITYPSNRTVNYTFDSMGRINQITTTFDGTTTILASNITYEPFGAVHSFAFGDGHTAPVQTYTRNRDLDGRIGNYTLNGDLMSIGYDAASQVRLISDLQNPANIANYNYDPMSRLYTFSLGTASQSFIYDTVGNRINQTLGSTFSTYGYPIYGSPPTSNKLASIQTGTGAPQNFTPDANGSTTADPTRLYGYDIRGRLIQTTTAQGVINYEVNALGLRVRKQVPYASTDTLYHYDSQGHVIGENPAGTIQFTREYIYLGDQPVAVLK